MPEGTKRKMTTDERLERIEEGLIELASHTMALLGTGHGGVPRESTFAALYALEADVSARRETRQRVEEVIRSEELNAARERIRVRTKA